MNRLRTAIYVLTVGIVTWMWSETWFWGRPRPDDDAIGMVATVAAYSLCAWCALVLIRRTCIADPVRLMLAGALLGWLVEGVVVATTYQALPLSIVWTGVAWHGLVTVLGGWWWVPRVLRRGHPRVVLSGVTGVAVALGGWSAFMHQDAGVGIDAGAQLVWWSLTTSVLAAAYVLGAAASRPRAPADPPQPDVPVALTSLRALSPGIGLLVVWWVVAVVLPLPWSVPILAVLGGGVVWAARRTDPGPSDGRASGEPREDLVATGLGIARGRWVVALALIPPIATGTSLAVTAIGAAPLVGPAGLVGLSVAGTWILGRAIASAIRRPQPTSSVVG